MKWLEHPKTKHDVYSEKEYSKQLKCGVAPSSDVATSLPERRLSVSYSGHCHGFKIVSRLDQSS